MPAGTPPAANGNNAAAASSSALADHKSVLQFTPSANVNNQWVAQWGDKGQYIARVAPDGTKLGGLFPLSLPNGNQTIQSVGVLTDMFTGNPVTSPLFTIPGSANVYTKGADGNFYVVDGLRSDKTGNAVCNQLTPVTSSTDIYKLLKMYKAN